MQEDDPGDIALQWMVRLGSGNAGARDMRAYAEWRALDPLHEHAAQEAEALWHGIGMAGKDLRARTRMTRRAALGAVGAVAVGGTLYGSGIVGPHLFADYRTATGQQAEFRLQDGSHVHLNAASALSVDLGGAARRLRLWRGQATFTVAHDPSRPFIVRSGGGEARAIGTVFDMNIGPAAVAVTTLEGVVAVRTLDGGAAETVVTANQGVAYADHGPASAARAVNADSATAWRRGRLVFDDRPLGQVMDELSRYLGTRIIVASASARDLPVTGAFSLAAPDGILDTMERTLPITVRRLPLITIIR